MIIIVDYDMGNVGSIANMINKIGLECELSRDPLKILTANHLILPGVGHFDSAVKNLKRLGLFESIKHYSKDPKKYLLGICLGMQLLGEKSEEGVEKGLNIVPFNNFKFSFTNNESLRVPNMGWNKVKVINNTPMTKSIDYSSKFYFVHSYYVPVDKSYTLLTANYGINFSAAIQYGNVIGTQFHPEKSLIHGMKILESFLSLGS